MSSRIERPISATEIVDAVVRHRLKVLLWTVIVISGAVAAIAFWPRKYESEAKVFLRLGRESIALDPTATMGATVQIQESRENQLNSARDMFRSRSLLEGVVEKFGTHRILKGSVKEDSDTPPSLASQVIASASSTVAACSMSSVSPDEQAVEKLSKSIGIFLPKNSSVISVTCQAKSPKLAQEILQAFLDCYGEQHLAVNHTAGSFSFFTTQAAQAEQALDVAAAELRDLKNELNLISIPVEQESIQALLTKIEAAMAEETVLLTSHDASMDALKASLDKMPETMTTQQTTGFANVAADNMHQEYFKQLISVNELQAKLGESHPLVKIAREGAAQLQQLIDKQAAQRTQTTVGVNLTRQTLETDFRREVALEASTRAKIATLKEQYSALQERLRTINQHEVLIASLERRVKIADAKYRSYTDRLEQARIGDALEAERISNINVVQPPSFVEKPVSPKPLMIFGLALIALVGGALGLVFGSEFMARAFADPEEGISIALQRHDEHSSAVTTRGAVAASRGNQLPLKG